MSEFSLNDAISGQQGQNANNPWGGQNPGQYPGGQQYPGQPYPGPYPGYPGYPGPGQPGPGQQYPAGGTPGQQVPGFPPGAQQYPGFPGYPGFSGPGQSYPSAPMPGQPTDPKMAGPVPSAPAGPLNMPYVLPLPSGIVTNMMLIIEGVVKADCGKFAIDLKNEKDIAFHFNPRFTETPNVIVRNSCTQGRWANEERPAQKFPFVKGQPFMIQIFCETDQYRVVVNNENICQFKHRDRSLQQIRSMCICGDIVLNKATAVMM